MLKWRVTGLTLAEQMKANEDMGYVPREYEVCRFEAPDYRAALRQGALLAAKHNVSQHLVLEVFD